jgi:hypothetical protein
VARKIQQGEGGPLEGVGPETHVDTVKLSTYTTVYRIQRNTEHRIQNTESRIQNTEYRIQHTEKTHEHKTTYCMDL